MTRAEERFQPERPAEEVGELVARDVPEEVERVPDLFIFEQRIWICCWEDRMDRGMSSARVGWTCHDEPSGCGLRRIALAGPPRGSTSETSGPSFVTFDAASPRGWQ